MAGGGTKAVVAAMIANAVIAVAKFVAAAVTGSSAMLSEGIHSVADTGNQALLLVGNRRSHKPPDSRHPFGYGQELYFWSLIVAMILFGLGGGFSMGIVFEQLLDGKLDATALVHVQHLHVNLLAFA